MKIRQSPDSYQLKRNRMVNGGKEIGNKQSAFIQGSNEKSSSAPKAYINYILFDEQFRYVGGNFSRVGGSGSVKSHRFSDAQLPNIAVQKNGYLYVYVSNGGNVDVFFDCLQVIHTGGPILEETHYFPFGLTNDTHGFPLYIYCNAKVDLFVPSTKPGYDFRATRSFTF